MTKTRRRSHDVAPDGDWQAAITAYLLDPTAYWDGAASRHAQRIAASTHALRQRDGLDDRDVVAAVVTMAAKRRRQRPAPLYVTGLDPSGSRRVADTVASLPGVVAAGAIELPQRLLDDLSELSRADQACAVDALALLHGWPRTAHVWAAHLVHESEVHRLRQHSRRDPDAVAIHVARDPRDQVLSIMADDRLCDGGDTVDDQCLRRIAARVMASFEQSRAVADLIDLRCRYEDVVTDPRPLLRSVRRALRRRPDDTAVEQAAKADAHAPSGGSIGARADASGADDVTPRPRSGIDPARERLLHIALADAIHGLGYQPGDCMSTPVPDHTLGTRTLRGARAAPGLLYQRVDGDWVRVDTHSPTIGAGVLLMLRMASDSDLSALHAWAAAGDVQALCLAGNASAHDEALRPLARLVGLRILDLARTPVTDAGLAHVARMTGLQQLLLTGTATTAQGRATLARALPQLTIWT